MNISNLQELWRQKYRIANEQLQKTAQIECVATAFNTNIDAVIKISGQKISELAKKAGYSFETEQNSKCKLDCPLDVVRGLVKCFQNGIAEEWLADNAEVYYWMRQNIGHDKLQMGGQSGIIANTLALTNVNKVLVHTASHPKLQAEQFLDLPNLLALDENSCMQVARHINCATHTPLVHWIMEFEKGDVCMIDNRQIVCPKANRFIATYDPLNSRLVTNQNFMNYLYEHKIEYLLLSGYHMLQGENALATIKDSARQIQKLKGFNPDCIIHLEIASTQDKSVRAAIINNIAPLCDSIGLNERETLDVLEICAPTEYERMPKYDLHAPELFSALCKIKEYTKVKRVQMHMFGLYISLQDKTALIAAQKSIAGMLTAATAAASKAYLGALTAPQDLLFAQKQAIGKLHFDELEMLAEYLQTPGLLQDGYCQYENYEITAIPSILIDKPKTLVGMGDTISSLSLLCAR